MDIENLLRLLNENSVDYVVIGATAFPTHGYSRACLSEKPKKMPGKCGLHCKNLVMM